jgi:hypothetical protein
MFMTDKGLNALLILFHPKKRIEKNRALQGILRLLAIGSEEVAARPMERRTLVPSK